MNATVQARTARSPRTCGRCQHPADDTQAIGAGHRYLRHVAFPGHEANTGNTQPFVVDECISCLAERDDSGPLLVADACGSYCCGVEPCARPFTKGTGCDHQCRRCVRQGQI